MTQTIGSRRQVWNGTAKRTSGGLTKSDLMMSHGRIVSKSKHFSAKKEMRLLKYGYGTQKGKFGFVKIGTKKHRKGHKKMRGGHAGVNMAFSPASAMGEGIDGQGITNYGSLGSVGVQAAAGMAGGRRRSRRMQGGSGMRPMEEAGSANWSGDNLTGDGIAGAGITVGDAGSANLQLLAGMAGGRRRRGRGRGRGMRGGTTKVSLMPQSLAESGSPLGAVLTH
jgi:hypothetical protein